MVQQLVAMPAAFLTPSPIRFPLSSSLNPTISTRPCFTMSMSSPRVLVPIATGSEEIEASTIVDTLRRAGCDVTLASVESSLVVTLSRSMRFEADALISSLQPPFDMVALPGGMPGAERLADSKQLEAIVKDTQSRGKTVAAICAAPAVALAKWGILEGKKATCYPADPFRNKVVKLGEGDVVTDGSVVTGTGPGTALKFSLQLVEVLFGKEKADKLGAEMLAER